MSDAKLKCIVKRRGTQFEVGTTVDLTPSQYEFYKAKVELVKEEKLEVATPKKTRAKKAPSK